MRAKNTTETPSRYARVYSYLRFSTPKQAAGSSAARQTDYAERWAAEHGLQIDESLSLRDEGLSAYHQKHIKKGALGAFLRAIESGRVPSGSVLVVEGLDRLSRAEPLIAQTQLSGIITAGVTVVTAADGQVYSFEGLKKDPAKLFYSLAVMIRAHEESDTKSKRIRAAYRRQCEAWIAGAHRGLVGSTATDPVWVTYSKESGFALEPMQAQAMRRMLHFYKAGYGAIDITKRLTAEGLSVSEKYPTNRVGRLVKQRNLMGDKVVVADGQTFVLKGYYPPLITESEFDELQLLVSKRQIQKGKGELPSLITGLQITYCGYCGKLMVGQNMLKRSCGEDGLPRDGHRRLRCGTYYKLAKKCVGGESCSIVPIEKALMAYCSSQMNLNRLLDAPDRTNPVIAALATARGKERSIQGKLEQISTALLEDGGDSPATFLKLARDLEKQLAVEQINIESLERELSETSKAMPSASEAWAALAHGVRMLDYDARIQARKLVSETFKRIDVMMRGAHADQRDVIRLRLTSKAGVIQEFDIDRKTGERIGGGEVVTDRLTAASAPRRMPGARTKAGR